MGDQVDPRTVSEDYRLSTFRWWPASSPVEPNDLARAGFFFLGYSDHVQCFSCRAKLVNWVAGDTAMGEHRRLQPQCPFLNGTDTRNIPLRESGPERHAGTDTNHRRNDDAMMQTSSSTPTACAHPRYADEAIRLATLQENRWRFQLGETGPTPKLLAAAGFFYTGPGDRVRCFSSGCVLRNWRPTDDPWLEHVRLYPKCQWVTRQTGQSFITDVLLNSTVPHDSLSQSLHGLNLMSRPTNSSPSLTSPSNTANVLSSSNGSSNAEDAKESGPDDELPTTHLCKVCLTAPLDTLFMPCKHAATCGQCATRLTACPLCRRNIDEAVRIYI